MFKLRETIDRGKCLVGVERFVMYSNFSCSSFA